MKLYIKQKVFSLKDRFTVKNANGEDCYFVEGKLVSIGQKKTLTDAAGNELATIRQKVLAIMPKFIVEMDGKEVAWIKKKFTFLKPKYVVEGLDWDVEGNFLAHDYTIAEHGKVIANIHKKWMAWGDTFELDINDNADEVMALAVILAIDSVIDSAQAAAATVNTDN
ncbi:MAG: LURP-one-related family protein [Clostridia bacterium]|nr:LURP-one-related family protein [Clostridia bacterium]